MLEMFAFVLGWHGVERFFSKAYLEIKFEDFRQIWWKLEWKEFVWIHFKEEESVFLGEPYHSEDNSSLFFVHGMLKHKKIFEDWMHKNSGSMLPICASFQPLVIWISTKFLNKKIIFSCFRQRLKIKQNTLDVDQLIVIIKFVGLNLHISSTNMWDGEWKHRTCMPCQQKERLILDMFGKT